MLSEFEIIHGRFLRRHIDIAMENCTKADTFENCEVTCAIWEEIFEDIDDALKQLKETDDDIKADLTQLSITNVEQNKRLTTVEELAEDNKDALNITTLEIATLKDKNDLLTLQNSIFENSIKTIEARLDILEENAGPGFINVTAIGCLTNRDKADIIL